MSNDSSEWSSDVEFVLDKIRQNSVVLSEQHKKRYFSLQSWLKYFRLPCIILGSCGAVASVGLQSYLIQKHISLLTCVISLTTTIITSIELYLQIEKQMTVEIEVSKEFYLLGIDIFKTLNLNRDHRNIDASAYLDSVVSQYKSLYEHSGVLEKRILDKMTNIDIEIPSWKPSTDELDVERSGEL